MFESLSERLQGIFHNLRGQRITEEVLEKTLRQIRMALLEADVHVSVVRELTQAVREKGLREEVLKSLSPEQQVIKIVRDELLALLGGDGKATLRQTPKPPTVVLMTGLQGSGKTTSTAKLGLWLKKQGRYPYLVPADVYRPAAVEQLVRVARSVDLPVMEHDARREPLEIAREAVSRARASGFDTVLVDTAGRLHVDEALMEELRGLKQALEPAEILFVADAMTGQDAVRSAGEFHRTLGLTGVVLTKMDGDARGGAALSIRKVSQVPIKFVGTGEKPSDLEPFDAGRLVGRILGMGDVLGFIERAEEAVDAEEAAALEKKLRKNQFTLEEFRSQLRMVRRMGPLSQLVGMLPGMGALREADLDPKALTRVVAILDSMTPEERRRPQILNGSRKRRIARGAGQKVQDINRLLKQFAQLKKMMKTLQKTQGRRGRGGLPFFGR